MTITQAQVCTLIADLLGVDTNHITVNSHLRKDLKADSLDLVELIMNLADNFDVKISDTEVQNIQTVGEVIAYIEQNGRMQIAPIPATI